MFILGIDPGLANTGWGVIELCGNSFQLVNYGIITTKTTDTLSERIANIGNDVSSLIDKYGITELSIEDIFFAKNEVSAIGVAKVIGAVSYAASLKNVNVHVFTPLQIKMAITGYGRADKLQIQKMTSLMLKLNKIPKPNHCADALAAAVCYINTCSTLEKMGVKK